MSVSLSGGALSVADVARIGRGADVAVDPDALVRVGDRSRAAAASLQRGDRAVYGRTTGVGANRDVSLSAVDTSVDASARTSAGAAMALWRSHAGALGTSLDAVTVRTAVAIRVQQLLAGGSGASAELVGALLDLLNGPPGALPVVHGGGEIGTGDLPALAQVGLALAGERPRADGSTRRTFLPLPEDGLALLSSNAVTLAVAALGLDRLLTLTQAAVPVCALSWVALDGGLEPLGPAVPVVTPFDGARRVASATRALLADTPLQPRHVQDFFGLRTWPQAHGPTLDALDHLRRVVEAYVGAPPENPVYLFADGDSRHVEVAHHGGFLSAYLTLAVDTVLLALVRSAQSSMSRVSHLVGGVDCGLPRFLADGEPGSSGLLVAEYAAASALARVRTAAAAPASLLSASVSAGVEDDASFAGLAAARLGPAAIAYREVLAVELVCAVRALRMQGRVPEGELGRMLWACRGLPPALEDRDLEPDFAAAASVLDVLAGVRAAGSGQG